MVSMIFARSNGEWLDFPPLNMLGKSGDCLSLPTKKDLIPLPEGATLTMMPGAFPYGFDPESGQFLLLEENPYQKKAEPIYAMAALLPQGFSRGLLPAATLSNQELPLLGYTAVGIDKGRLMVCATQTDEHNCWHPRHYNTEDLPKLIEKRRQEFPHNSIIEQLAHCSLEYGCFTAQNIFYRRWEGGIPISPACNAHCLGCISLQESQCCPSPQNRIAQPPKVKELVEVMIPHLTAGKDNIISFGQGCEGEPSLEWKKAAEAIKTVRRQTRMGTINMNTNASLPPAIDALCAAGLDSLRVSLFSPLEQDYNAYHRPQGFTLKDVEESLAIAASLNIPVALNLLAYPGYTDRTELLEELTAFCSRNRIRQLQVRNLNIDPCKMQAFLGEGAGIGLRQMLDFIKLRLPDLEIGNYSRPQSKHDKE